MVRESTWTKSVLLRLNVYHNWQSRCIVFGLVTDKQWVPHWRYFSNVIAYGKTRTCCFFRLTLRISPCKTQWPSLVFDLTSMSRSRHLPLNPRYHCPFAHVTGVDLARLFSGQIDLEHHSPEDRNRHASANEENMTVSISTRKRLTLIKCHWLLSFSKYCSM